MNTREREVMDALAEALRGVHPNPGLSTTLAAYDALLAEGSASSEGAEAVAPFGYVYGEDGKYRHFVPANEKYIADVMGKNGFAVSAVYTRPQPAQGEPAASAWMHEDDPSRVISATSKAQALRDGGAAASSVRPYSIPLHREHEQRSCEESAGMNELESLRRFKAYVHQRLDEAGIPVDPQSPHRDAGCRIGGRLDIALAKPEQRPIADEVMELSNSLDEDAALLRGLIDDGVDQADSLDRIADSMERASELMKSALPRGLHAGSYAPLSTSERAQVIARLREVETALRSGTDHRFYAYGKACGRMADGLAATAEQPAGSDAPPSYMTAESRVPDDFRNSANAYIAGWNDCRGARIATAEQPSCGQDAWELIETAPKDRRIVLYCPKAGEVAGNWNDNRYAKKPNPYWTNDREHIVGVLATRADQPTHWRERSVPAAIAAQQRQGGEKENP